MSNLLKCNQCGSVISSELSDSHECCSPLIDVKQIPISYYYEAKSKDNDTVLVVKGLDGILYRLVLSKTKTFTNYPTDFDKENNRRRLDRTLQATPTCQ